MSKIPALVRRELAAFFISPMAYIVATVFLVILGLWFAFGQRYFSVESGLFARDAAAALPRVMGILVLCLTPLLTMRLLADEIRTGTIETLLTAPVSSTAVVLSKFLGTFCFFALMLIPTLAYPVMTHVMSGDAPPDAGPVISGYFGLLLLGMTAISVGVFVSAGARSQIAATVATTLALALLWVFGSARAPAVRYIGVLDHFESFVKGVIDTRDVLYFVSATAFFLFAAVGVLAVRRWR